MDSTASTQLKRYTVSFAGYRSGMFSFGYEVAVDAPDQQAAIVEAGRVAKEKGYGREASGSCTAKRLYSWAVTLRGLDKRKRETYHVVALSRAAALRHVGNLPAAARFAGFYGAKEGTAKRPLVDERIVSVVCTDAD